MDLSKAHLLDSKYHSQECKHKETGDIGLIRSVAYDPANRRAMVVFEYDLSGYTLAIDFQNFFEEFELI